VIAASPEHVYAALVDPEALSAWLPPTGMTGTFERFDPRPGGSYRLVLTYADASASRGKTTTNSDIVESRFIDLVPGVRVVQAVDFVSDDPAYAGSMRMTWEITAVDEGTRVDIVADNVPMESRRTITQQAWPPRSPTSRNTSSDSGRRLGPFVIR
jgi:uncharacterized protein YndB with AHSA1/START domain